MQIVVKLIASFMPNKALRHRMRDYARKEMPKSQYRKDIIRYQDRILKRLRERVSAGHKIRVAYLVILDSSFPAEPLFKQMLKDELFAPFIVVIPDICRGRKHMLSSLYKTYHALLDRYGEKYVLSGYDEVTEQSVDISDRCDLALSASPYKDMTDQIFSTECLLSKGVLSLYVSYGYSLSTFGRGVVDLACLNLCWRIYAEHELTKKQYADYAGAKGLNVVVAGYPKMDALTQSKSPTRKRKMVMLCPHHTVTMRELPLSNFLRYSDFFLELPRKYPDIDWVFRPHPLLYVTLCRDNVWGKERTDEWFAMMEAHDNVVYDTGGGYLALFAQSDAMIHDCCSFLAEYLYTGKPSCFMLGNYDVEKVWNELGCKCLENCYQPRSEQEIVDFIEQVIIRGEDPMRERRLQFAADELMINYPHASEAIMDNLKKDIL